MNKYSDILFKSARGRGKKLRWDDLLSLWVQEGRLPEKWPLVAFRNATPTNEDFAEHGFEPLYDILDSIRTINQQNHTSQLESAPTSPEELTLTNELRQRKFLVISKEAQKNAPMNSPNRIDRIKIEEISLAGLLRRFAKASESHSGNKYEPTFGELIDLWREKRLGRPPLISKNQTIVEVPGALAFPNIDNDWDQVQKDIFDILDSVWRTDPRFRDSQGRPNLSNFVTYSPKGILVYYKFTSGVVFTIETLLFNLSQLLSKKDPSSKRYSRKDVIELWQGKRHGVVSRPLISVPLELVSRSASSRLGTEAILNNLFDALTWIWQNDSFFADGEGKPKLNKMTRWHMSMQSPSHLYAFKGSDVITLESLLKRYEALLKSPIAHKSENGDFTRDRLLEMWRSQRHGFVDVQKMSDIQIRDFVQAHHLEPLFEIFADDPRQLVNAIRFSHRNIMGGGNLIGLVGRYYTRFRLVNMTPARNIDPVNEDALGSQDQKYLPAKKVIETGLAPIGKYLEYLRTQNDLQRLDLSDLRKREQIGLFIHLFRRQGSSGKNTTPLRLVELAQKQIADELHALRSSPESSQDREEKTHFREGKVSRPIQILRYLEDVYQEVENHFRSIEESALPRMRKPLYPHQKEPVVFLTNHPRAFLADDVGLGKTVEVLAASEKLFEKNEIRRVLYVTTVNVKSGVARHILGHTYTNPEQVLMLATRKNAPEMRKTQIRLLVEEDQQDSPIDSGSSVKYIVANYDILGRMAISQPDLFSHLIDQVDLVIVDEAQLMDNSPTIRSQAMQLINPKWKWVVTATPYQSDVKKLWVVMNFLFPERFPSAQEFNSNYLQDEIGLELLHSTMMDFTLRRTKNILPFFEPPSEDDARDITYDKDSKSKFYSMQLGRQASSANTVEKQDESHLAHSADSAPFTPLSRMPRLIDLSEQNPELGAYQLTDEQTRAVVDEVSTPSVSGDNNFFKKIASIRRIIYDPTAVGLAENQDLLGKLDGLVETSMHNDEKIILWAVNVSMIEQLSERYSKFGVQTYYGKTSPAKKQIAEEKFQNDSETRILVANIYSAKEGQNFSAATRSIFVQLPESPPHYTQVQGRIQRSIGLQQIQHAKPFVYSLAMVPKFSPSILAEYEELAARGQPGSKEILDFLKRGTIIEHLLSKLSAGKYIVEMIMNLGGNVDEMVRAIQTSLAETLDLGEILEATIRRDQTSEAKLPANSIKCSELVATKSATSIAK
ncbi:MAG: DEAD/DEAH box helicase [Bdellovibrionales bacterium]|nr:DEAD/DEAH box helicase [Bdellovibrionales bacterium]